METSHGWTTGDPSSITIWEHLPTGLRCHLILQDKHGCTLTPRDWEPVEEYLPDADGHSTAHLVLKVGQAEVEMECGGEGDVAACRVWKISDDSVRAHWEVEGAREGWQVQEGGLEVAVAPRGAVLPADVSIFLRHQREIARQEAPQGGGLLEAPLAAMDATIAANTVLLPETGEMAIVSRHTAEMTGGWHLPNWQTFLSALGIAYVDPALAVATCRTAVRNLAAGSILGAESLPEGVRSDISHPPVASYAIWKTFQLSGDASLLADAYPLLLRWHDWWRNFRDGNHDRLFEWASAEETGMPGHPLYEKAAIDDQTNVMRLDDVGLCSLWALDAFALMRIALQLNDLDMATHLEAEIHAMADRMNLTFWDPDWGIFRSKTWDDLYTAFQTVTAFFALTARIPTRERVREMLNKHLALEFNTPYLLATVGNGDAAYGEQLPWRGRVSPLVNLLVCEGLRHFAQDDWAERITLSGLELVSRSWDKHHQVFDSYNAITGRGDDLPQDALASSSVLFSALGIAMLIDVEPWNGMRLGNLCGADMAVSKIVVQGNQYSVYSSPHGLSVDRNGAPWLETDRPAILRNILQTDHEITLQAKIGDSGKLRLRFHGYAPGEKVNVRVNGSLARATVTDTGIVECTVDLTPPPGRKGPGIPHV